MAEGGVAAVADENTVTYSNVTITSRQEATEAMDELAHSYSEFLNLDFSCEKPFNETVEELLTKLDEYIGFADLVRSDVNLALFTTLSSIQLKGRDMQKHFDRIDRLEAFMAAVKRNVTELEAVVDKAESDMGRMSSIKKVINSFSLPSIFTPKSQLQQASSTKIAAPVARFEPVAVFRTDDYFKLTPAGSVPAAAAPPTNLNYDDSDGVMSDITLVDSDSSSQQPTEGDSLSDANNGTAAVQPAAEIISSENVDHVRDADDSHFTADSAITPAGNSVPLSDCPDNFTHSS